MADWKKISKDLLLADGSLDADEASLLEKEFMADGIIDNEEFDFLVDLKNSANSCSPEFLKFYFSALASNILVDGVIDADETKKLRELLFADGVIDNDEREFLINLKDKASSTSPAFEELFAECTK